MPILPRQRYGRALRLTALVLPLALTACGGDAGEADETATATPDYTTPAGDPAAAANARDACTLVTADEVSATTGISAEGRASANGGAQVCTWTDTSGRSAVVQLHPTAARHDEARGAFASLYGSQGEDVHGLGDRAYYIAGATSSIPTATIGVLQGQHALSVQVMGMGQAPDALRTQAVELARAVAGKL